MGLAVAKREPDGTRCAISQTRCRENTKAAELCVEAGNLDGESTPSSRCKGRPPASSLRALAAKGGSMVALFPSPAMSSSASLDQIRDQLRAFVAERDWDQFHNPKNLAMAMVVEAGELLEHFQWLTPEQADALDAETRAEVELEVADVLLFLLRLCDRLDIDPLQAAQRKLVLNARKYPADKARGRSTKYDKL